MTDPMEELRRLREKAAASLEALTVFAGMYDAQFATEQEVGILPALAVVRKLVDPATVRRMVMAHDREDAAQMGEPSPWHEDFERDGEWEAQRIAAMSAALAVLIGGGDV